MCAKPLDPRIMELKIEIAMLQKQISELENDNLQLNIQLNDMMMGVDILNLNAGRDELVKDIQSTVGKMRANIECGDAIHENMSDCLDELESLLPPSKDI